MRPIGIFDSGMGGLTVMRALKARLPKESFVYLEQTSPFQFKASTIKEFDEGRWLTMDAGDVDGDGDDDIVLGSLVPPLKAYQEYWLKSSKHKGQLLLLENR